MSLLIEDMYGDADAAQTRRELTIVQQRDPDLHIGISSQPAGQMKDRNLGAGPQVAGRDMQYPQWLLLHPWGPSEAVSAGRCRTMARLTSSHSIGYQSTDMNTPATE